MVKGAEEGEEERRRGSGRGIVEIRSFAERERSDVGRRQRARAIKEGEWGRDWEEKEDRGDKCRNRDRRRRRRRRRR